MTDQWSSLPTELCSGDPDRVDSAVEEIKALEIGERAELFEASFDRLTAAYAEADDGYDRQSLVRAAEQFAPGLPAVAALDNESRETGVSREQIRTQTDALSGFLLEAVTDDDGRVRQSAQRALKRVLRTYDGLEDTETIRALGQECATLAEEYEGTKRKHLLEVTEDAEFFAESGVGRLVRGFEEEFGDSPDAVR